MSEHGIYKYVSRKTHKIVYIGKSNRDVRDRIIAHMRKKGIDAKFAPYLEECDIYTATLPNKTETDLLERALINKYKPVLNDIDNHPGFSELIQVREPEWVLYKPEKKRQTTKIEEESSAYLRIITKTSRIEFPDFEGTLEDARQWLEKAENVFKQLYEQYGGQVSIRVSDAEQLLNGPKRIAFTNIHGAGGSVISSEEYLNGEWVLTIYGYGLFLLKAVIEMSQNKYCNEIKRIKFKEECLFYIDKKCYETALEICGLETRKAS